MKRYALYRGVAGNPVTHPLVPARVGATGPERSGRLLGMKRREPTEAEIAKARAGIPIEVIELYEPCDEVAEVTREAEKAVRKGSLKRIGKAVTAEDLVAARALLAGAKVAAGGFGKATPPEPIAPLAQPEPITVDVAGHTSGRDGRKPKHGGNP